jgi:3-isopropylmalate/(R)-2-methylmalate dehydratase large subunit
VPAPQLEGEVAIDIAYGGSCTAGKREDFDFYHEVLRWGVEHGMGVAPRTRLYLQFGTMAVRRYCEERGYLRAGRRDARDAGLRFVRELRAGSVGFRG